MHAIANKADVPGHPLERVRDDRRKLPHHRALVVHDLGHHARTVELSAVGDRRRKHGHLDRGHQQRPLSDGQVAGVSVPPPVVHRPPFPRVVRNKTGDLEINGDLGLPPQPKRGGLVVDRIETGLQSGAEEVHIAGVLDALFHVEGAVPARLPATEARAAQREIAGARVRRVRRGLVVLERRESHHGLERASRRVRPRRHAIQHRLRGILQQRFPSFGRYRGREFVQVESRRAGHGQDIAVARIHHDPRAGAVGQRALDDFLDPEIERQLQVQPVVRRALGERQLLVVVAEP
ncbi:MAG: hypothetical protein BWY59_00857 [Verrucomicrobia bacterium ADurb.Bin345]|nr:MAG: hypothetical protein BWY59_00857 [Verrucomicrobia bacterium ADurb.Bin345]